MTNSLSSFTDIFTNTPPTEGIKYAGSKRKLLPYILDLTSRTNAKSVLDGFSGATRVSQAFARTGYKVISNDIAIWSEVFGRCYLQNKKSQEHYEKLIKSLNSVVSKDGWFTEHYGGLPNSGSSIQHDGLKRPWQIHNTRKLDGIREEIDNLSLSPVEKAVALTSLILALDRVDSTLGHFVSYLKEWSPRSYKELHLKIPNLFITDKNNEVLCEDIFDVVDCDADLAYFDPPYGSNNEKMPPSRVRYASYYHLWATICLNDSPELFGKAKRRKDTSDTIAASIFEEFKKNKQSGKFIVVEAIEQLIQSTTARWIILSYSSGGRATADELHQILSVSGDIVDVIKVDHKRNVMSEMKWTNEWVHDAKFPESRIVISN